MTTGESIARIADGVSRRTGSIRTAWPLISLALVVSILSACSEPTACTLTVSPDVALIVIDSVTGHPAASGAAGQIQDGNYHDVFRPYTWRGLPPNVTLLSLQAGGDRGGTYLVTLDKPGYSHWQAANLSVRRDGCHVQTVTMTARLHPTS